MGSMLLQFLCFVFTYLIVSIYCYEDFPRGHLKPFGGHIPADNVVEYTKDNLPSPKKFMEEYVIPRKPLVFRGIAKDWPAFSKWTDEFLKGNYGDLELRMEARKEKESITPQGDVCLGRDSMKNFIETYHNTSVNKYVVSELPVPLHKDVSIPPSMGCGDLSESIVEIDMWMNSGGARSLLHKDAFNTVNCVVNGSKEWKLVELKYNNLIYQAWEGPNEEGYGGHSLIDPEKVDLLKFPKIAQIPQWQYTHIKAGDCLYLPSQIWHVVHSHGDQNIAVAYLFDRFEGKLPEDIDYKNCAEKVKAIPLEETDVTWKYSGHGRMSMGNAEFPFYWNQIKRIFHPKTKLLSKKRMFHLIKSNLEGFAHKKEMALKFTKELFSRLTEDTLEFTYDMMRNISVVELREIINEYIEPPERSNTCDREYFSFSPLQIKDIMFNIAEKNDNKIEKEKFYKEYLSQHGSRKFADEIWSKYAGDKNVVEFIENDSNLEVALENFEWFSEEEEEDYDPSERNDLVGGFKSEERQMEPDFKHEEKLSDRIKDEVNNKQENKKKEEL